MSPIWDDDIEAAALGAALSHPRQAALVVERCQPTDFYRGVHRLVLAEVARLLAAGERPDAVAVAVALPPDDRPHVLSLPSRCPVVVNAPHYITLLRRLSARHRLALACEMALDEVEGGLPEPLRAELVAAAGDRDVGLEEDMT